MGLKIQVAIIEYCDLPTQARFMTDERGGRLIFDSHDDADNYLTEHAEEGVYYKHYDGQD